MNSAQIKKFILTLSKTKDRNIVLVDYANVDRWQESLGWVISIKKLGDLIKHFAVGKKYLRRFYYGEDYGPKDSTTKLVKWSEDILMHARFNNFEIVSKRVKYIPDHKYQTGFIKKCNLDIEMAVDLLVEQSNYDTAIVFSGDGDLVYAYEYVHTVLGKRIIVFAARNHLGREVIDAKKTGIVENIFFIEDFESRLNKER